MNETATNDTVERIPLIAYEAEAARYSRIIRLMATGWTLSVIIFAAAFVALRIL